MGLNEDEDVEDLRVCGHCDLELSWHFQLQVFLLEWHAQEESAHPGTCSLPIVCFQFRLVSMRPLKFYHFDVFTQEVEFSTLGAWYAVRISAFTLLPRMRGWGGFVQGLTYGILQSINAKCL